MIRLMVFSFLICFSAPAFAQDNVDPKFTGRDDADYLSGSDYKGLVYDALEMKPDFDFGYFRFLYSSLQQYTPLTDDLQRELLKLAATIKLAPVSEERTKAMEQYTNLVLLHLANIDVVVMALSISEENSKLGNPKFYKWMYEGLLNSVLKSGDGSRLSKAFNVVTLGEESALLARMGLKIVGTTPAHEGDVYYNMHRVQTRSGQTYTIFVDTTKPMELIEKQMAAEKYSNPLRPSASGQIK